MNDKVEKLQATVAQQRATIAQQQKQMETLTTQLKERRKNEAQEATIARLEKQIQALTVGLQKVSAQLELSKAAPQTALNRQ